jgi:glycosyltransferase involved in cell wall biosynthesis
MSTSPQVSVIMTAYNSSDFIGDAISSIMNQTMSDWELIVVDDGSVDETVEIIDSFNDDRIKLLRNKTNQGQSYSRNLAIRESSGLFIAIMDSDDIAYYDRIENQLNYLLKHPDISFCCSWADTIDEYNRITGLKKLPSDEGIIKLKLLFECPIIHPTVMWRKSEFIDNNLWYDDFFVYAQDYDLWSRAIEKLHLGVIEQPLLKFRFHHSKSISHSKKDIQIRYAKLISVRNLRKISKIAPLLLRLNCLICKIILFRIIVRSDYLSDMKDLKVSYFRNRLFDGTPLPQRIKDTFRRFLLN